MARNLDGLVKRELEAILTEEFGYGEDDLKENGRPVTNAKLKDMIKQEDKDAKELKSVSKPEPKPEPVVEDHLDMGVVSVDDRFNFDNDDLISVMNGLQGALVHRSQSTGRVWQFTEFGQTERIPYGELVTIRNTNPRVFSEGWMIVLNRQIQEEFDLTEMYKHVITPQSINKVFDMDVEELGEFIDSMPRGAKSAFIGRAKKLYNTGKLDSMAKIQLIQDKFGISLDDNAPLSDIAVKAPN